MAIPAFNAAHDRKMIKDATIMRFMNVISQIEEYYL